MHFLPLFLSILLTASAVPTGHKNKEVDDITEYRDGPTADGDAGLGIEFESPTFYFINNKCSQADTDAAKKHVVSNRKGTNWMLTADTGSGAGKLFAEVILDGQKIKIGKGDAEKAAKAAADDIIKWKPWTGERPVHVEVDKNKCNPWTIDGPSKRTDPEKGVHWAPQVTAPMPLEGLYSIMKDHHVPLLGSPHILDGMPYGNNYFELVTKDYFQAKPNGIDKNHVTDDVLAFASLVLSYAKAAKKELKADESPKLRTAFMPRTEFNTLYKQVKSKLPGDLFNLFNTLACYTTSSRGHVSIDKDFCSGKESAPKPNTKFASLEFKNPAHGSHASMKIKSWIEGIGKSSGSTDMLTTFDKSIDGSIGGLGSKMENMFGAHRQVPLFEFRGLLDIPTKDFESWTKKVDHAIQDLHKKHKTAPK